MKGLLFLKTIQSNKRQKKVTNKTFQVHMKQKLLGMSLSTDAIQKLIFKGFVHLNSLQKTSC